jgi:large subunit ribosomal protein L13
MIYTIDAQGKKLGRVASEAATYLMGKNTTTYTRNEAPDVKVHIINASKAMIDAKKKESTIYPEFTGFRGGLNDVKMSHIIEKSGYSELFKRAITGMLPQNSLKKQMLKNLTITE